MTPMKTQLVAHGREFHVSRREFIKNKTIHREHKIRTAEMEATAAWADALTEQSQGKHHIGDFLPPEELKKFMEIYKSKQTNREPDLSDYKEYKLTEDNKGIIW